MAALLDILFGDALDAETEYPDSIFSTSTEPSPASIGLRAVPALATTTAAAHSVVPQSGINDAVSSAISTVSKAATSAATSSVSSSEKTTTTTTVHTTVTDIVAQSSSRSASSASAESASEAANTTLSTTATKLSNTSSLALSSASPVTEPVSAVVNSTSTIGSVDTSTLPSSITAMPTASDAVSTSTTWSSSSVMVVVNAAGDSAPNILSPDAKLFPLGVTLVVLGGLLLLVLSAILILKCTGWTRRRRLRGSAFQFDSSDPTLPFPSAPFSDKSPPQEQGLGGGASRGGALVAATRGLWSPRPQFETITTNLEDDRQDHRRAFSRIDSRTSAISGVSGLSGLSGSAFGSSEGVIPIGYERARTVVVPSYPGQQQQSQSQTQLQALAQDQMASRVPARPYVEQYDRGAALTPDESYGYDGAFFPRAAWSLGASHDIYDTNGSRGGGTGSNDQFRATLHAVNRTPSIRSIASHNSSASNHNLRYTDTDLGSPVPSFRTDQMAYTARPPVPLYLTPEFQAPRNVKREPGPSIDFSRSSRVSTESGSSIGEIMLGRNASQSRGMQVVLGRGEEGNAGIGRKLGKGRVWGDERV